MQPHRPPNLCHPKPPDGKHCDATTISQLCKYEAAVFTASLINNRMRMLYIRIDMCKNLAVLHWRFIFRCRRLGVGDMCKNLAVLHQRFIFRYRRLGVGGNSKSERGVCASWMTLESRGVYRRLPHACYIALQAEPPRRLPRTLAWEEPQRSHPRLSTPMRRSPWRASEKIRSGKRREEGRREEDGGEQKNT